jgi:lipid II:glycine glycyltransferase (peptidoglycan interpeptide bridge formation enzyme)
VAGLIMLQYRSVSYAKYEGVDGSFKNVFPVNALFWKTIEDACRGGDRIYDFGRTALDNKGLNEFKSRWGTTRQNLPYCFHPPGEGISVVKSDSLKYRLFTGMVKRLPASINTRLGAKLFRHFG